MHRSYATSLENGVYVMMMMILAKDNVIRICVNSRRRKRAAHTHVQAHTAEWLSVDENKSQKFSVQKLNNLVSFDSITYAVIWRI